MATLGELQGTSIYRVLLQAPIAIAQDIKYNVLALEPLLTDVMLKHPLSIPQLSSLRATIASLKPAQMQQESEDRSAMQVDADPEPSDTAIVTALFGCALSRPEPLSLLRASSATRGAQWGRGDSPSPILCSPLISISQLGGTPMRRAGHISSTLFIVPATRRPLGIHITVCYARRQLTIAITTKERQFDGLNEHRLYYPYAVRSTVVPRPHTPLSSSVANAPEDGAAEGWRAVLTVVLRHGLSERQCMARFSLPGGGDEVMRGMDSELEGVEAMVAGVKSKGGRELLKYVKGLLG
ncbi:hypothetical protein K503DRAFT_802345 [Rhizopogon vinicolor AM-OR11-026]|uniref:Uncharacterized protein n=1 Tax=Rhizopogon vinicolor AM-OR11-026 TaxID=1314800 RepID=A0A1B7MTV5_9AGAM|nr:hypothetical protein K503DRAFT_802345 [Rhizopogon vinicolor AM-OR11-026]